ncbi:hypothetical protein [Rhabdothermincola salaria]|uniref:hypothetical protein n=1 Tax=Rhabdothermincola salaria TaxID=2903142 RepID=UPI001E2D5F27|nr:hypothetical protein [Rhabdothermincola salaria]MCD9623293.1 hypothetical protein [Rhabdothermincola salaria]
MPASRAPSSSPSVEAMVTAAGADRETLDALRAGFQARIARRSDDFEATKGLQLTEHALSQLSRDGDPWDRLVRKLVKD